MQRLAGSRMISRSRNPMNSLNQIKFIKHEATLVTIAQSPLNDRITMRTKQLLSNENVGKVDQKCLSLVSKKDSILNMTQYDAKSLLENQDPSTKEKPSKEQMDEFHKYLETNFKRFFTERINWTYFEPAITMVDCQSGHPVETRGLQFLVQKISYIRIYYSLMYSFNTMTLLSIVKVPEEDLIKLRWRITSKGRLFFFFQFWKVKELKRKEYWNDGIVHFYLNSNGKVHHMILEKTEKDKQQDLVTDPLAKVLKDLK